MLDILHEIDGIRLNFSDDNRLLLNITIAFIMFGVALELKPKEFIKLFKSPKIGLTGIVSQFILLPLITFLLAWCLSSLITPTIGLGMILVASCPGGNISNFISSLARGNIALSVSLTAFSSLGALIFTPLNFTIWGNLYLRVCRFEDMDTLIRQLHLDPIATFHIVVLILGIPVVLGMLFNAYFPKLTQSIMIPIKRISILAFAAMVIIIFAKNHQYFIRYIPWIAVIVLIHNAIALGTGFGAARVMGLSTQNQRTIAIETGIQNSGLALTLLFDPSIFPESLMIGGMAFITAWWGIWHILAGLGISGYWTGFKLKPEKA